MRISFGGTKRKFITTIALGSFMTIVGLFSIAHVAAAPDCDNNAIIKCGFTSSSNFISKVNANSTGDLKAIYSDYGLVSSDYAKFASSAESGTAYKDGRIVVNGQVVGHATQSIGRQQNSGNTQKVTIAGKTYWGGPNSAAFGSDSLPVTVLFNAKGVMQFAVLNNCGNPETITPVTPTYSCDALHKSAVSGQANTYNFTTAASASHNASVVKAVYDFGDGHTATVTDLSQAVQHTFTKSSTITVTVTIKVPGGTLTTTSVHCKTTVTVTPPKTPKPPTPSTPYAECTTLDAQETDNSNDTYMFTANASFGNGASFNSADFDFGDGVTMTGVVPNNAQAIISHSFASGKSYTIQATLHFTDPDGSPRVANCQTSISPVAPTQYCKPGVVQGSPDCTTTTLVNTGAGATAGIFGGVGMIGGLGHYFIRKRGLLR